MFRWKQVGGGMKVFYIAGLVSCIGLGVMILIGIWLGGSGSCVDGVCDTCRDTKYLRYPAQSTPGLILRLTL